MFRSIVGVTLMLAFSVAGSSLARASFEDGLRAFDAGDYGTAASEWRALANVCNPVGEVALAGLYRDGLGVPQDNKMAIYWYKQAANADSSVAQMALGEAYAEGRGVPKDLVAAYKWLSLAARQGKVWAAEQVGLLYGTMDDGSRQQGQRAVVQFRAVRPKRCG